MIAPTIPRLAPWDEMRAAYRAPVPERFNIGAACLFERAAAEPDRPAVIDLSGARRIWTYGDMGRAAEALAAHLHAEGVGPGDRVAILLPQRAEVLVAHFAAHRLGAVSLPLFTLFGPEALDYRLRDSGAVAIVAEAEGLAKVAPLDLPALRVRLDVEALPEGGTVPIADTAAEDPAMMIYTSGTTGEPKGVLHAHRFLLGHLACVETALEGFPQPGDVAWTPADWAWIGGLMDLAVPAMAFGVPLVAKRFAKFDAAEAYALMAEERVTAAFLPPTALKMMRRASAPDGLCLRAVMSGGEALGADLLQWGRAALGAPINEIYGQTEVNLVMAACAGTQAVVPGTLGRAVPGVEVEVQDEAGGEVPMGAVGEICVRGSLAAFLRYWRKPEETAAKWRGGWIRTGDLGERLAGGVIRYHARGDDVIASSGYRVGPTEIESCLAAHPRVVMAAVVGLPDPDRGEAITAFVVAEGATDGLEAELIAWVRARLSPHMAPRAVHFRDALPMTATGKVQRRALRGG
ncbi:AMP-binding protein [Jannaschia sp. W003]|uniref:AMP-binding protein n=1 Tax=Jannaschia sp. W003 TaxID=2867012 RepID=UPI0021A87BE5|nr:AMP-binding protein [Jannaschia sp. W003]UWQ21205.1 AMP-binding protein [Jannaschia sp. W003]